MEAYYQREWEEKWADNYLFLKDLGIKTVLDIGANRGQFAKMIRHACPDLHEIHSFEPLTECHSDLECAVRDSNLTHKIHAFGLGDKNEGIQINHCEFSPCSSILTPSDRLVADRPGAGKFEKKTIRVRRLDDFAAEHSLPEADLIKIDVQGYEDKVISGGSATLSKARFVIIEMPFHSLYEKQPSFHDVYMMLHNLGFTFQGNAGQNVSKKDHKILEADSIFENQNISQ